MFKIEIDDSVLKRTFTDIEKRQLPFAFQQSANKTAFETREEWKQLVGTRIDRPTPYTRNAVLYEKADIRKGRFYVEVFIRGGAGNSRGSAVRARSEVTTGTPPDKYLQWLERGGSRNQKSFERKLSRFPGAAKYYAGGRDVLDSYGNVSRGTIQRILSQLRVSDALAGSKSNETDEGRKRRLRRQRLRGGGGSYFMLDRNRGKLRAGVIYERIADASISDSGEARATSSVRTVLFPINAAPTYSPRLGLIKQANAFMSRRFTALFNQELARAVRNRKR